MAVVLATTATTCRKTGYTDAAATGSPGHMNGRKRTSADRRKETHDL